MHRSSLVDSLFKVRACVRLWQILLQKSFWGSERKFLEPLMRFTPGDVREPYRFIQNRSRTSAVALKSDAAAEKSKNQLSRDFQGRSIFDFCNNIGTKRTCRVGLTMSRTDMRQKPGPFRF
jgi:hypothetical protein